MRDPVVADSYDFDAGRVIALQGELDVCTGQGLAERLSGLPGSLIVVDLARLTFMDSSGLGLIHQARRKAIEDGGNLVVCNPSPTVLRVLEITGLDLWVTDWDPAWSKGAAVGCAVQDARSGAVQDARSGAVQDAPTAPSASRSDSPG